ncbi:polysaccharide biosynthesis protein [Vagococcus intermedius]|uniref:Polysaccharide biosynthesis protein n=1 Tax=Vagococcus intermedius TaxID=2991418 RepID=A0AAF0CVL0_9ENTE|nr:nucleoside-diphosphate sugar epimerase/dehydratase [Vagococcus intermedius]WEG73790.1 polysaccharide biosynthesis protein [Vagococcus intermedius]WEG75875.1 polysaccharide biosynthesis protein [Vagococcus intermedius]
MSRKVKISILISVDLFLISVANIFSYLFLIPFVGVTDHLMFKTLGIQIILYLILGFMFNIFTRVNRYTNLNEIVSILAATTLAYLIEAIVFFIRGISHSQRYLLLTYLLTTFFIIASRISWKVFIEHRNKRVEPKYPCKPTLVIGAGAGGAVLISTLERQNSKFNIMGLIDDDPNKANTVFCGKKVRGTTKNLQEIVQKYDVEQVIIAIPSLKAKGFERILKELDQTNVKVSSMPSIEEIVNGDVSVTKLREIDVVDLLGREEVKLDTEVLATQLTNQTIMVTGAGGSIGSEICRQVMRFTPKKIILVGHGENSIYLIDKELRQTFKEKQTEIVPVIADIQDRERIFDVVKTHQPAIIYHAAAHKHVPMMEYNPTEAVKNNVYGTKNVAEAAKANHVTSFVMVSTDKANNPPNVMGSTKRIAEMIVTGLNEAGGTKFSAVRFGNVLGSRGSVVPLFKEQLSKGGPLTVTDMRMTRYFMTIPEASRLVLQSGALAKGGEVFVLDMGDPVKISHLAEQVIKLSGMSTDEIKIVETGIRPGEKLYEELLVDKELAPEQIYDKIFVGNVTGFPVEEVLDFVETLPEEEDALAKELVSYANQSSKG